MTPQYVRGPFNRGTAFVVFHVVFTGALACQLRRERPLGPWVHCVVCERFGPKGVNERGIKINDYAMDSRD